MSDIPLPANGVAAGEQPSAADERPAVDGPVGRSRRVFSRMAIVVILIFWMAQFTFLTVARLMRMPEESLFNIYPRAVVTTCAILLSFALLATLRAVRRKTLVRRALIAVALAVAGCAIHAGVNMTVFTLFYQQEPDRF